MSLSLCFFFFFQAEDGIRDKLVTGVQTCALPIWRRTLIAAVLLGVWAGGIEARLLSLQIYRHADLVTRAARQQMRTIVAPAKRGDILDRHGRVLATSVDADSIYAVPSEIGNAGDTAGRLCDAFGDCTGKERQAATERLRQARAFPYGRAPGAPHQARPVGALD